MSAEEKYPELGELTPEEKTALDELREEAVKQLSRLERQEVLKGAKIQSFELDEQGNVKTIIVVKDLIAREMTFSDGVVIRVDGELI